MLNWERMIQKNTVIYLYLMRSLSYNYNSKNYFYEKSKSPS